MHRACTGEDARLVCLGVSPSPRVCAACWHVLLYFTLRDRPAVSSPFESRYFGKTTVAAKLAGVRT